MIFTLAGIAVISAGCRETTHASSRIVPTQEVIWTSTLGITPSPSRTPILSATSDPAVQKPTQVELVFLPGLPVEASPTPVTTPFTEKLYQPCSPLSIHPLEELREIISDPYHPPPPGREERHQGVDFSYYRRGERTTIQGVGVQSVFPGRVAASIQDKFPYGNMVIIETPADLLLAEIKEMIQIPQGESLYTLYAHMDKPPLVTLDQTVDACQAIGEVGKSGNAAEPHLHLEMRLGPASHSFTSMAYYGANDTPEEREAYTLWRTSWKFRHFDPMLVLGNQHSSP